MRCIRLLGGNGPVIAGCCCSLAAHSSSVVSAPVGSQVSLRRLGACQHGHRVGILGGLRRLWGLSTPSQASEDFDTVCAALGSHPDVEACKVIGKTAYVVRKRGVVEDTHLKTYLQGALRRSPSLASSADMNICFADSLSPSTGECGPFTLIHALDALFQRADRSRSGQIDFQAFMDFCHEYRLFNATEMEAEEVFLEARHSPTTTEALNESQDLFHMEQVGSSNILKFYEFQKLVLDAGLLEATAAPKEALRSPYVSFFIDDRVADIVVEAFMATCDSDQDGLLSFQDYVALVSSCRLPVAPSEEAFKGLDKDKDGALSVAELRGLLEEATMLTIGASVSKDDVAGHLWREIEESQVFAPPTKVFVADARPGVALPKAQGTLRFVCISDTHGQHGELTSRMPPGDVLVHTGDFSMGGELGEVMDFGSWLLKLPYKWKIFIAGNHDLSFEQAASKHERPDRSSESTRAALLGAIGGGRGNDGIFYLEDEECSIEGVRVYGTPWQPEFGRWAFNLPRGEPLAERWKAIPDGIDILMVHGPPLGRGDACLPAMQRVGCDMLLKEVQERIRPSFCVYGHVHEGAGVTYDGVTHYLNASSLNERYECVHAPLIFDVPLSA